MTSRDTKPILPICFCVHRNVSMGMRINVDGNVTRRLTLVTEGIRYFLEKGFQVNSEYLPDAAILLFDGSTQWLSEFGSIHNAGEVQELQGRLDTECCLGHAMSSALEAIENRVEVLRRTGKNCLKPILVVISAGEKNDGFENILNAASLRCGNSIKNQELTALMYAVSLYESQTLLQKAAPDGTVTFLADADIVEALSNVGQYVQAKYKGAPEDGGNAEEYILGIYTDVS